MLRVRWFVEDTVARERVREEFVHAQAQYLHGRGRAALPPEMPPDLELRGTLVHVTHVPEVRGFAGGSHGIADKVLARAGWVALVIQDSDGRFVELNALELHGLSEGEDRPAIPAMPVHAPHAVKDLGPQDPEH